MDQTYEVTNEHKNMGFGDKGKWILVTEKNNKINLNKLDRLINSINIINKNLTLCLYECCTGTNDTNKSSDDCSNVDKSAVYGVCSDGKLKEVNEENELIKEDEVKKI
ncbi:hypothetical protein KM1_323470 [Entamoeba histolytica HM-3:IMSS]|uniref:Uncharacterized protein n=4 Tax=Entamoeba histolytica TaxID=5759 RepID=B1N407_ENTH1|nr:hypothetical protein EHI_054070 [Entamoeba histolytica HM-1:IMSS]EDS89301.1 hypothetical protein EHI_054070 [Entamoeba histolytica HM-1:IMSS]EMD46351.1 Hypothetical protein EHI5A_273120 [Entamoeba histolytica KU27]EMS14751.1 hypothetical protein KM1_323470 [Entamoeba histolytica HM-3:IMSS]GAT97208.1 hypothetical protein CL6EHI_054070 [Entamoeba histolytica]|eukprot:XP_001913923.1 hypothetical protein EHI_054070 [Entamoeba histolytica HM-1:IMSS]